MTYLMGLTQDEQEAYYDKHPPKKQVGICMCVCVRVRVCTCVLCWLHGCRLFVYCMCLNLREPGMTNFMGLSQDEQEAYYAKHPPKKQVRC
jgi:hypothetical protein